MKISIAGENALIIYFGEESSAAVSAQVQQAAHTLTQVLGKLLIDLIPSYASLLVIFDPLQCDHLWVRAQIRKHVGQPIEEQATEGELVELPVYYSTESGPDLENLAQNAGLTPQQVIDRHSGDEYRVYAIGFAPGFAYLGEVDEKIAAPRLTTPRKRVPRGAVGIADRQTAIYPAESPGGWNLIGLCPLRMFDPDATPTMPVAVGDRVKFNPITKDEFLALGGELSNELRGAQ